MFQERVERIKLEKGRKITSGADWMFKSFSGKEQEERVPAMEREAASG